MTAFPPRSFLILHGWQNHRPVGHWQRWLAESLRDRGHVVRYPQLPHPDRPAARAWISETEKCLAELPAEPTVICHSLACIAWLLLARESSAHLPVGRVVFVAPPSSAFLAGEPRLASFATGPDPQWATASSIHSPRLVISDNDPYNPPVQRADYTDTFVIDEIPGEGHFDMPSGYGEWPSVLEWCEDPTIHISARPRNREQGK